MNDLSRNEIIKAIDEVWWDAIRNWSEYENVQYFREPDMERLELPGDGYDINTVFNSNIETEKAQARIREVVEHYMNHCNAMAWWTGACCRPENIGETLKELGFIPIELIGMALDLNKYKKKKDTASDFKMEKVSSSEAFSEFCGVWNKANDSDRQRIDRFRQFYGEKGGGTKADWTHFIGRQDTVPVATASICVKGSLSLVNFVSTLNNHRGQGYGSMVTEAAIMEAKNRGCRYCLLQATVEGASIYRKIGFEGFLPMTIYTLIKEHYKPM